jgi:hypothetical protein
MQQLGLNDGRNVRIDTRWAEGDSDSIRRFAVELVALAPDVIVGTGSAATGRCYRRLAPCRSCLSTSPISTLVIVLLDKSHAAANYRAPVRQSDRAI